jgi:hypothetical protein
MYFLSPLTLRQIWLDEDKMTPEVAELLEQYDYRWAEARKALEARDIAMLRIIEKVEMPFNDFLKRVTGFK